MSYTKKKMREWKKKNRDKVRKYSKDAYKRYKYLPKYRYAYLKKQAQRNNREFSLTLNWFTILTKANCYYCGSSVTSVGGGLDRIDSSRGYTPENVVACCKICNWMKRHLSFSEFINHVKKIIKHGEFIGEW